MSYKIKNKNTGKVILATSSEMNRDSYFQDAFSLYLGMGGNPDNFNLEKFEDDSVINIIDQIPESEYTPALVKQEETVIKYIIYHKDKVQAIHATTDKEWHTQQLKHLFNVHLDRGGRLDNVPYRTLKREIPVSKFSEDYAPQYSDKELFHMLQEEHENGNGFNLI